MKLTVCGMNCDECPLLGSECQGGCEFLKGRIYWIKYIGSDICPVFRCAREEMKFKNCGECRKLPCELWFSLKDPSLSDEEHLASVNQRVTALKGDGPK